MNKSADEIKAAVDVILAENNAKLDTYEKSILDEMVEQEKNSEEYISYLEKLMKDYENGMSSSKPAEVIRFSKEILTNSLRKSPAASNPVLPEFEKGTVIKKEIKKQFGEICQNKKKVVKEELLLEGMLRRLKTAMPSVQLVHSAIEIKKIYLSLFDGVYHLSFFKSGTFWASDNKGNLVQFNMDGKSIKRGIGFPNLYGHHTVTDEGDLIFTDLKNSAVCKFNNDMTVTSIIKTCDWEPTAICSSHLNRDILLGMIKEKETQVARYQNSTSSTFLFYKMACYAHPLCRHITYITENINGDICISDCAASQVMVVTKSGEYRFSYSGHMSQSGFLPYGICTDFLGNILVCNDHRDSSKDNSSIHILDQKGEFLFLLPAPNQCSVYPGALCIDNDHNLLVGCYKRPTVTVYKYMHLFNRDN